MARHGTAWRGTVNNFEVKWSLARQGAVRHGSAGLGWAWPGGARQGKGFRSRKDLAGQGAARLGTAGHGQAWQGMAWVPQITGAHLKL